MIYLYCRSLPKNITFCIILSQILISTVELPDGVIGNTLASGARVSWFESRSGSFFFLQTASGRLFRPRSMVVKKIWNELHSCPSQAVFVFDLDFLYKLTGLFRYFFKILIVIAITIRTIPFLAAFT